jgi:succinate dehydrogenase/fumarate reductase flavoprotein subunit
VSTSENGPRRISRRDFIKGVGVGAAAVAGAGALASCGQAAVPGVPETWDKEADVVVIGSGAAGGPAAVVAHDTGASVIVLEKMPAWGGSLAMAAGVLSGADPSRLDAAIEYMIGCGMGLVDRDTATAWAQGTATLFDFIQGLGGTGEVSVTGGHWPHIPGADAVFGWASEGGSVLATLLQNAVNERGSEVMLETSAKELVVNAEGEVIGVIAEQGGTSIAVKAKRGVILACGGMEYNEWMKSQYFKHPLYGVGNPGNTGDAITMAGRLGAKLWKPDVTCGLMGIRVPGTGPARFAGFAFLTAFAGVIFVDKNGKRFCDETLFYDAQYKELRYFDPVRAEYPRIPCYGVFSETAKSAGATSDADLEAGLAVSADTIGGLAAKIGIDPTVLEGTISQYNEYCAAGQDPDFGRAALIPVDETPPYYAVESYPVTAGCFGGPQINGQAQVLNTYDQVIPRLYAAGCASGGAIGLLYPVHGISLSNGFTFGRIAGENAAKETPLT